MGLKKSVKQAEILLKKPDYALKVSVNAKEKICFKLFWMDG